MLQTSDSQIEILKKKIAIHERIKVIYQGTNEKPTVSVLDSLDPSTRKNH